MFKVKLLTYLQKNNNLRGSLTSTLKRACSFIREFSHYAYKIEKIRKKNHLEFNVKYKKRTHLLGFIAYFSLEDTDVNGGVMDNLFCFAQSWFIWGWSFCDVFTMFLFEFHFLANLVWVLYVRLLSYEFMIIDILSLSWIINFNNF